MLIKDAMNNSLNNTADIFKALGDPSRLKIIKLILTKGNNLCVGMIANKLGISQPAVSQHLKILKNAGLVESDRMGFHMHYSIKYNSLDSYGINITELLKNIEIKYGSNENCEHKGNNNNCDDLNK